MIDLSIFINPICLFGNPPIKIKIKKKKIILNETQIDKASLTDDHYYFIKEYYINNKRQSSFEKFKEVWEENFGMNDYLIPINKEYRKEL